MNHDANISQRLVKQFVHRLLSVQSSSRRTSFEFLLCQFLHNLSCHSYIRPHFRIELNLAKSILQLMIIANSNKEKHLAQIFSALALNLSLIKEPAIKMVLHQDFQHILPLIVSQKSFMEWFISKIFIILWCDGSKVTKLCFIVLLQIDIFYRKNTVTNLYQQLKLYQKLEWKAQWHHFGAISRVKI